MKERLKGMKETEIDFILAVFRPSRQVPGAERSIGRPGRSGGYTPAKDTPSKTRVGVRIDEYSYGSLPTPTRRFHKSS